ncbi:exported protein [Vibrio sp. JCM 19236]|nr:exported protein [Vibrio sp. JCM 19236]
MATNLHSRREFLKLSASTGIALVTGCTSSGPKPTTSSKLVGCATDGKGNYMLAASNINGELLYTHPLASRGHSVAHGQKTNHLGVFARRPGYYLDILDADSGAQLQSLEPPKDRFFYGHGVYDNASPLLYTTEGVIGTCEGVIGIYDASNKYRRIGEWTGFGIGLIK